MSVTRRRCNWRVVHTLLVQSSFDSTNIPGLLSKIKNFLSIGLRLR